MLLLFGLIEECGFDVVLVVCVEWGVVWLVQVVVVLCGDLEVVFVEWYVEYQFVGWYVVLLVVGYCFFDVVLVLQCWVQWIGWYFVQWCVECGDFGEVGVYVIVYQCDEIECLFECFEFVVQGGIVWIVGLYVVGWQCSGQQLVWIVVVVECVELVVEFLYQQGYVVLVFWVVGDFYWVIGYGKFLVDIDVIEVVVVLLEK